MVVVGRLRQHPAIQPLVQLCFPYGETSVVCDPDEPWPDELRAFVVKAKGTKPLRGSKRLGELALLDAGGEHWIVRRRAGEAIQKLAPDVALVPAPLCDAEGWLDGDWVLLDVRARRPLDRARARFTPTSTAAPHASLITAIEEAPALAPAPLFRLAEAPALLCASDAVLAALREVLGPFVAPLSPPYQRGSAQGAPCAPLSLGGTLHQGPGAMEGDEASAKTAFGALERLLLGRGEDDDRSLALASPIAAYHLARDVERAPSDDTRAAACRSPRYATLYARDVDRGPRDDTRAAACRERFAAHLYLAQVERARHPELTQVLGEANVEAMFTELPALRATLRPPPPRFSSSWLAPTTTKAPR